MAGDPRAAGAERINEIRERAAKATPGPWYVEWDGDTWNDGHDSADWPWRVTQKREGGKAIVNLVEEETSEEDAEFVAHAREDVPWLLDQLADARAEAARYKAALEQARRALTWPTTQAQIEAGEAVRAALGGGAPPTEEEGT